MVGHSRWRADRRPYFKCFDCLEEWTSGISGDVWSAYCQRREAKRKPHEPHYWSEELWPTEEPQ